MNRAKGREDGEFCSEMRWERGDFLADESFVGCDCEGRGFGSEEGR